MMINAGYENFVRDELIAAILQPDSSHAKKLRQDAADRGLLINTTAGHKTRSVIVLTTGQIVLSSLQSTTLKDRVDGINKKSEGK